MKISAISRAALAAIVIAGVAMPAGAQGRVKGAEKKSGKTVVVSTTKDKDPKIVTTTSKGEVASTLKDANRSDRAKSVAKGPKKKVTSSQAVLVTREVLIGNGYQVVNVVPTGTTQVIYYRRGNRGNGRGLGPVQKIVVVPAGDVVRFQSVPEPLLATILRRLGM
ncbi:MAG TPA: hypothetical protein VFO55_08650 [Gemmatimonadaceae bacterium]|nr:hypothetical protein [Gemmatimonadaceae bacterium]